MVKLLSHHFACLYQVEKDGEKLELKTAVGKDKSSLVSATIKMSTFSGIKLDIFLNLFRTEFIFIYDKIVFLGFFKRKVFISEISECLSKESTSSLINVPSCPVMIQSAGKDFTNLRKFLARAAVPFLFRSSLPLFRHDLSIFELPIKPIPAELQKCIIDIIDPIFIIFILC